VQLLQAAEADAAEQRSQLMLMRQQMEAQADAAAVKVRDA